jgi:Holliday junction resolvase RusA-like endonuclease
VKPVLIVLDGEPRGKGRPRFSRKSGVAFTPAETRKYEAALRLAAQDAMENRVPFECPLRVVVEASMPIPVSWPKWKRDFANMGMFLHTSKPDVDNLMKMMDAFNEIVWRDDSQISSATVTKRYSAKPSLRIEVHPLEQAVRPAKPKKQKIKEAA